MRSKKYWVEKAEKFAKYVRSDYNKDRHILATLGSFGITFRDDASELMKGLNYIGETGIVNKLKEQGLKEVV